MSDAGRPGVSVVVLAKDSRVAKTRLQLPGEQARRLALDLAAATVRVALSAETVGAVFVVTGDAEIARDARQAGARVVAEPRLLGMVRAAAMGRRQALEARPEAAVAILVADLPELRPPDLDAVVREFIDVEVPLFVADHQGIGTTLLIHGPDRCPGIGFGRSSAAMHRRLGYRPSGAGPRSLRRDLDTAEDLAALLSSKAVASL